MWAKDVTLRVNPGQMLSSKHNKGATAALNTAPRRPARRVEPVPTCPCSAGLRGVALVTGAGDKATRTIFKCSCSFVVSLSLCLSSAQNYCCFQIWNLVHFYFKMTLQVFICDIHFNSTLILHNSHMIQCVCFMRQTWHMKIKNRFFVWNTERNRRGKKKKQWEHTSKDQGGGKMGRKKQDETSESFHPARSENSSHQ